MRSTLITRSNTGVAASLMGTVGSNGHKMASKDEAEWEPPGSIGLRMGAMTASWSEKHSTSIKTQRGVSNI